MGIDKEKLRKRQQELKIEIEISNLRMIVSKQRNLLSKYNTKLDQSTSSLRQCNDNISSQENIIKETELMLQQLKKRKHVMEGMLVRATRKLVHTRSRLSKRSQKSLSI